MSIGPNGSRPTPTVLPSFLPSSSGTNAANVRAPGTGNKTFLDVLSEGRRHSNPLSGPVVGGGTVGVIGPARTSPPRIPATSEPGREGLRAIAESALRAEKTVDALIAAAARGRTFSAAELIALQATVFRYSQTIEVISRAADRLVGAIKQTLGTQV